MGKDFNEDSKYKINALENQKPAFIFLPCLFPCNDMEMKSRNSSCIYGSCFLTIVSLWQENVNNGNKSMTGFVFWSLFGGDISIQFHSYIFKDKRDNANCNLRYYDFTCMRFH